MKSKKTRVKRAYPCSRAVLLTAGGRINNALGDTTYGPPIAGRLPAGFVTRFDNQLSAAGGGGALKASQAGDTSRLTKAQQAAYTEVIRLTSAARRSANLAFPGDTVVLHEEFQVGKSDGDQSLQGELDRATIVLASTRKYAAELGAEGWAASDATELETNLGQFTDVDLTQEASKDSGLDITDQRTTDENLLYRMILTAQNAARLQYPSTKPDIATARARYLINEFPPHEPTHNEAPDKPADEEGKGTGGTTESSTGGSGTAGGGTVSEGTANEEPSGNSGTETPPK
jgi:hypothetical protein